MKTKISKYFFALATTIFFTNSAIAQTADEALETVKKSVVIVLSDLKANENEYRKNPAALNRLIDTKMLPYFDSYAMAKLVLAKNWKNATEEQRRSFINEFKKMIMREYSSRLLDYTNSKVTYGEPSEVKRNRTKIDVTVTNSDGKQYPLTLSMGYKAGAWKVYDIKAMDGFSVITSYRGSVGEQINNKGLQAVIDGLREKNQKGELTK